MGAGIAQLAAQAGAESLLHIPHADIDAAIAKIVARWERKQQSFEAPLPAPALEDLAGCDVIVEAAPEKLELKRELFGALGEIAPGAVLASNTSSIPITAIASASPHPERVVGMHFFNPAPVMRLVEVIAAVQSAPEAVQRVRELGEAMGKRVIDAADVAGFVVNRTNRPFGVEAMRCLEQQIADVETIDRIYGLGGTIEGEPFYAVVPLALVEVTGDAGERAFSALGLHTARVQRSPGGVLPRVASQLVNEAHFSLGEGVASAEDIDAGLELGLNHPRGPFAWAEHLGRENVLAVLAALRELHGDGYRPAPALRA